jgi:hypothetical protein
MLHERRTVQHKSTYVLAYSFVPRARSDVGVTVLLFMSRKSCVKTDPFANAIFMCEYSGNRKC